MILLVLLILWTDPKLGKVEQRYEVRVAGYYNTLERCDGRRKDFASASNAPVLYSECRGAD